MGSRVGRINPNVYVGTGLSVAVYSPRENECIFNYVMSLSCSERFMRGLRLMAKERARIWSSIPADLPEAERKYQFIERMYGKEYCDSVRGKLGFE